MSFSVSRFLFQGRISLPIVFGLLATLSGVLACKDEVPNRHPIGAVESTESIDPLLAKLAPPPPFDVSIARVHDLAGFLRDCGCSSAAVGGLARIPEKLIDANERLVIFTGWTLLSKDEANIAQSLRHSLKSQIRARRAVFAAALSALGDCVWVPEPEELVRLHELECGLESLESVISHNRQIALSPSLQVAVRKDGELVFNDSTSIPVTPGMDRGRKLQTIVVYGLGSPVLKRDARLSYYLSLMSNSRFDKQELAGYLLELRKSSVIGVTVEALMGSDPQDNELIDILDSYDTAIAHTSPTAEILKGRSRIGSVLSEFYQSECSTCHKIAVSNWVASSHSDALETLHNIGRHEDVQCLPCHSTLSHFQADHVSVEGRAVSCASCHETKSEPSASCEICHTSLTDPAQHFRAKQNLICGGTADMLHRRKSQSSNGESCVRQSMGRRHKK